MAVNPIAEEVAVKELAAILDYLEVEPEGKDWEAARVRLIAAIKKGRIVFNPEKGVITQILVKPIPLENGSTVDRFDFSEPNGEQLKILDQYADNQKMAKTLSLASAMSGQALGVANRMAARDLTVYGAIAELFF